MVNFVISSLQITWMVYWHWNC